jgi:hypothetical protein
MKVGAGTFFCFMRCLHATPASAMAQNFDIVFAGARVYGMRASACRNSTLLDIRHLEVRNDLDLFPTVQGDVWLCSCQGAFDDICVL